MEDEEAIKPRSEKLVDFYGDVIPVAQTAGDEIFVPIRPLAVFLGLDQSGQRQRIQRDPVLAKKARQVMMKSADGRVREQLCLPLDLLPGWLFGITTGKMSAEMAEKLNRYREQCFRVLWNAFKQDILPYTPAPHSSGLSPAEVALEIANAVQHLAQQQVDMEHRLATTEGKQEAMANYMRGFIQDTRQRLHQAEQGLQQADQRLIGLEMQLDPASAITEQQAVDLAIAVKTLAHELEAHSNVGSFTNGYAKVYSEMYRRYNIKSYKSLPRNRFDEVMGWLRQWYDEVVQS